MPQVQLAPNSNLGGLIQGAFGNYQPSADGSYTVDTRDAPPLIAAGMTYVSKITTSFVTPSAPLAATAAHIVASGGLSNGTPSIAAQPDVPRPFSVVIGTGSPGITAGTVSVVYQGNDGVATTDVFPCICAASSSTTQTSSKGANSITSVTVAGLVGGSTPYRYISTTATLAVPVAPGAIDFAVQQEWDSGTPEAPGSLGTSLGSTTPTAAPNGTLTYSFQYSYVNPTA